MFAGVVVSQGVILDEEARDRVIEGFSELEVDGFLLWVDSLDEENANVSELEGLLALARGLRGDDGAREVINLHGGYFSVLAAGKAGHSALSGVAHGPEFGEFRSVVPVGGGIPIARYYIPRLHARTRYREALGIFREKGWLASASAFHENVCNCRECLDVLAGDPDNFVGFGRSVVRSVPRRHGIVRIAFPTGETTIHCLKHYLQRKRWEYIAAARESRNDILESLLEEAKPLLDVVGVDGVAHLKRWKKVLGA